MIEYVFCHLVQAQAQCRCAEIAAMMDSPESGMGMSSGSGMLSVSGMSVFNIATTSRTVLCFL